jgi:hypothetical protein
MSGVKASVASPRAGSKAALLGGIGRVMMKVESEYPSKQRSTHCSEDIRSQRQSDGIVTPQYQRRSLCPHVMLSMIGCIIVHSEVAADSCTPLL